MKFWVWVVNYLRGRIMKAASWRVASGYESIWAPPPPPPSSPLLPPPLPFFFSLKPQTLLNRSPDTWPRDMADWTARCTVPVCVRRSMKYTTQESQLERRWDCVCVCVSTCGRQTEGPNSDWPRSQEQMANSRPAKSILLFPWFCLQAGVYAPSQQG